MMKLVDAGALEIRLSDIMLKCIKDNNAKTIVKFILQILHHWVKEFFAPLTIVAHIDNQTNIRLYILRDTLGDVEELKIKMQCYKWSSLTVQQEQIINVNMVATIFFIF